CIVYSFKSATPNACFPFQNRTEKWMTRLCFLKSATLLGKPTSTQSFCAEIKAPLKLAPKIFRNENCIRLPLCQTPHQVRIPFSAKWYINTHTPAIAYQFFLQVATDTVQHLKFKCIARDLFLNGKSFGLIDDVFVVCGQAVINAALQQNLEQLHIISIYLGFSLERDFFRLVV